MMPLVESAMTGGFGVCFFMGKKKCFGSGHLAVGGEKRLGGYGVRCFCCLSADVAEPGVYQCVIVLLEKWAVPAGLYIWTRDLGQTPISAPCNEPSCLVGDRVPWRLYLDKLTQASSL